MNKYSRISKHKTVRKHLGQLDRPRLAVFRSSAHIYAQIIDDQAGKTLAHATDLKLKGTKSEKALQVGQSLAKIAIGKKIAAVTFDRGGFKFHGRIAQVAKGAREGGLKF